MEHAAVDVTAWKFRCGPLAVTCHARPSAASLHTACQIQSTPSECTAACLCAMCDGQCHARHRGQCLGLMVNDEVYMFAAHAVVNKSSFPCPLAQGSHCDGSISVLLRGVGTGRHSGYLSPSDSASTLATCEADKALSLLMAAAIGRAAAEVY